MLEIGPINSVQLMKSVFRTAELNGNNAHNVRRIRSPVFHGTSSKTYRSRTCVKASRNRMLRSAGIIRIPRLFSIDSAGSTDSQTVPLRIERGRFLSAFSKHWEIRRSVMCRTSCCYTIVIFLAFPSLGWCQVTEAVPIALPVPADLNSKSSLERTRIAESQADRPPSATIVYFHGLDAQRRRVPFEERSLEQNGSGFRDCIQTPVSGTKFFAKSLVEPFLGITDLCGAWRQTVHSSFHSKRVISPQN